MSPRKRADRRRTASLTGVRNAKERQPRVAFRTPKNAKNAKAPDEITACLFALGGAAYGALVALSTPCPKCGHVQYVEDGAGGSR